MLRTCVFIVVMMVTIGSLMGRFPGATGTARNGVAVEEARSGDRPTTPATSQQINELDRSIELTRDSSGYFYADVRINGAPVHMLVDTGATDIALSRSDAQMAGIATSIGMNDIIGRGADGAIKGESVVLDHVSLGDKTVDRLPAIVLSNGSQSLLGQSFLNKFASVTIEGDKMVLR
ncbi:MAG TPA: TIGR02281 family clan AA aspartic protease [Sphingomicrobium sp.]|jgi:aspartyl protease family protein